MSDLNFVDAENQTGGNSDKVTFQSIVLQHYNRLCVLSCKDFQGGGTQERRTSNKQGGVMTESYTENPGEAFYNGVSALHDLLTAYHDKLYTEEYTSWLSDLESKRKAWQTKQKQGKDISDQWRYLKLQHCRTLFANISKLLNRLNYLEGGKFLDGEA